MWLSGEKNIFRLVKNISNIEERYYLFIPGFGEVDQVEQGPHPLSQSEVSIASLSQSGGSITW